MALLTSLIGMTPSFSPSLGSEKSAKASLISASSWAVMSFSLASRDCRAPFAPPEPAPVAPDSAAPPALRLGGCYIVRYQMRLDETSCAAQIFEHELATYHR